MASSHPAPSPNLISTSVPPPVFEAKPPERRNHLLSEEDEQIMRTQLLDFLSKNHLAKDVNVAEVPAQSPRARGGSLFVPKSHLTSEPGGPLDRPGEMHFFFEEAGTRRSQKKLKI